VKICITGGSGFIGQYFVERLTGGGHDLTILDLVEPEFELGPIRYVRGDIRDPDALRVAFSGCTHVIHLAAAHHDFGITEKTYFDVNERGSRVLCDVMDELGITNVVFYSTVAVYGDAPEPKQEDTLPQPNSPYGASKLAGERVFRAWVEQGGDRRALVIRPTVTFGPRNFANMYTLIDQIYRKRFLIVGSGRNIKSLSYVENIVDLTLHLWTRDDLASFEVFNYITKPDLTSMEITRSVYRALNMPVPKLHLPMWVARILAIPFDIVIGLTGRNLPVSSARLKKLYAVQTKFEADKIARFGYTSTISLDEGIAKMASWYLEQGKDQTADWHLPPAEPMLRQALEVPA
jgi:nucleoside-diphosphate-sugar epimerase